MKWHRTQVESDDHTTASLTIADQAIVLAFSTGQWWAIEDSCSHAGCSFSDDGEISDSIAVCNCHGSEFDIRSGAPLSIPAKDPIQVFPVRVVEGWLEVGFKQNEGNAR